MMKSGWIKMTSFLLVFCFCLNANAQTNDYKNEWKKVDELVKKNLPKSALDELKKIYNLAKQNKEDAQIIKSLVYITNLQQETREENLPQSIKDIEAEIPVTKEPAASILKSYLAGLYWNYYQQNRYQIYNRTQTSGFTKTDIATWGAADFHKKISELYLQSIKNEKQLQQTNIEAYNAIIIKGNMRPLRPTLYDLLAQQALSYFKNDKRDINKPAYAFEIDDPAAFADSKDFAAHTFKTSDSLSLQWKALIVYQQLLQFHLNDKKPSALIDADIDRVEYVYQKSIHTDKDSLYLAALENISQKYGTNPIASQAAYLIAQFYFNLGSKYQPNGDTTTRFAKLKAKVIAEKILQQDSASEGKANAFNLLQQINQKEISFEVEKVNVPAKPFRVFVNYKNVDKLFLKLVRTDNKLRSQLENQYDDKYWQALNAAPAYRSWEQSLPATNDFQTHAVEIKTDALPVGEYVLIASTDAGFNDKKTLLAARLLYISNISFINNEGRFFILNRESGHPLQNAKVQVWQQEYDYKASKSGRKKAGEYNTDKNGFFQIKDNDGKERNNYLLEITTSDDHLFMNDWMYDYNYYPVENASPEDALNTHIFLFTDRSIYRPGQTIFFKGITINADKNQRENKVHANYTTTIYLRDANYQLIDSLTFTTNEYGSFSGKFNLPQTGLNGRFNLLAKDNKGNASIQVEDYKRPKFYVDFEKIETTFNVNDTIHITGFAKAYAGNNIDGATVKYRVVRQPRFIYPWLFRKWWLPQAEPMEIAHGEAKTDADGKFQVAFQALPDLKIDKKFDPVFDYRIYADVTDINGETRSSENIVSVSYKSIQLQVSVPNPAHTDSLKNVSIITKNMNGVFVPALVKISIYKLQPEKRLVRNRYWQKPDQFVMSKEEYIKFFPHDEYKNESDYTSWEKGEKIFEKTDSTRENGTFSIRDKSFPTGWYTIETETTDKNGEIIKDVQYVELYDPSNNTLPDPKYLWTKGTDDILEPGQIATINIGSSADDVFLVQQINKNPEGKQTAQDNFDFINLDNEKKSFQYKISETDRGGFGLTYFFVKDNRFFSFSDVVKISWSNKELELEYASFRDKTLPGSEEKWTLKIKGNKNEKVAAEMLASMYDASLDQFVPHQWSAPGIWPVFANYFQWNGQQNFSGVPSFQKWLQPDNWKQFKKQYDAFIFDQYSDIPYMLQGRVAGAQLNEVVVVGYGQKAKNSDKNAEREAMAAAPVADSAVSQESQKSEEPVPAAMNDAGIQIRKNFNETVFFFPELHTDSSGGISFSFTMPDALTRWKFQALTHTKDLAFGYSTKEIVTQKELMVQPNAPRFLREGDHLELNAKIVNLSEKEMTGQVELQLFDATTNQPVDGWFQNIFPNQFFTVASGQSEVVKFPVDVPFLFNKALTWRIVAKSGSYSDGEENILPILSNRILVTETMPLPMNGDGTKNFNFDKLLKSSSSETLQNHGLTIEYTSNPAWYAVQALPYLIEYPYDCAEQTWNRFFANALATKIANSSPRIKKIFEEWKKEDTAAILSNLQKNQELKSVLLEETPWVLQAKNEEQQKKNLALLFDMVRMSKELDAALEKLVQLQSSNGGFVWFKGGPDDRYMTQYIVSGIGHLKKLNGIPAGMEEKIHAIVAKALPYLDKKMKEDYDEIKKDKKNKELPFTSVNAQYLYMRSFFPEYERASSSNTAYNYYHRQAQQNWTKQNKYTQGMLALALHRSGDKKTPAAIIKSLKETSINNEELGRYWKEIASPGWFWYQAPIETQSLMIEVFGEVAADTKTVDELRTWLLKNKQTNNWQTTKATAEAVYALLLNGTDWLTNEPTVTIKFGETIVSNANTKAEAGTGYIKKMIEGQNVEPSMGNISVSIAPGNSAKDNAIIGPSFGAVYWQYFEDMDKVTTSATPLRLDKKLFVETNTDRGPVLTPVTQETILKVGDKIKVRVELKVDRDMEYVHMKDLRASALEPVNVLSGYKWQGGLGYYESTRDAATHFFFDYLRKGTYVFEYPMFVTHTGTFSNGITTIQSMYAPEFTSHSEGVKIRVE